jgi:hypothetical protein
VRGRGAFVVWMAALVAAISAWIFSPPASAAVPGDFYGVAADRVLNDGRPSTWDAELGSIAGTGLEVVRSDAFWANAEPGPPLLGMVHQYNWMGFDQRATALAEAHLRWLPVIDYGTPWAESPRREDNHSPPANVSDFATYAEAFAMRYGVGGSFWSDHPNLPQVPVTTYEIWNEPNRAEFWAPGPDPARYAELYSQARSAIRRADPSATVLTGGLANKDPAGFVRDMYAAGVGDVDGIGFHPYARDVPGVLISITRMRSALAAVGAGSVPIYVTEVGWPTHGAAEGAGGLPEATRAGNLALLADTLPRTDCGVSGLVVYTWTTPEDDEGDASDWFGIADKHGGATVSSRAYGEAIQRNLSQPTGSTLPLCAGQPAAQPATLRLSLLRVPAPRKRRACYRARVTYQGLPVNRAAIQYQGLRPLSRRNRRPLIGRTAADGTATVCGRRSGRRVLGTASLGGVAASGAVRAR